MVISLKFELVEGLNLHKIVPLKFIFIEVVYRIYYTNTNSL